MFKTTNKLTLSKCSQTSRDQKIPSIEEFPSWDYQSGLQMIGTWLSIQFSDQRSVNIIVASLFLWIYQPINQNASVPPSVSIRVIVGFITCWNGVKQVYNLQSYNRDWILYFSHINCSDYLCKNVELLHRLTRQYAKSIAWSTLANNRF